LADCRSGAPITHKNFLSGVRKNLSDRLSASPIGGGG
jgi:hypothetical protein